MTRTVTASDETEEGGSSLYLPSPTLAEGAHVDRYRVISRIGAGGMGVVYAAHDPELDRRVALKLVRDIDEPGAAARRERLLREARAMAKLDHPHVVHVFDAGTTTNDQVFVVMELVDGERLDAWAKGRDARVILRALVAAGRGLAAAHTAGIVHRDFKPDNVLVDRTGRVRVGDFGLAAAPGETTAVMGTPAFMAPEQRRGEPADARADQYAFCVTAWLLVFGEHPTDGEPKRGPAWLAALLRTGLAADPAHRHHSLDELLDQIDRRLAPRRWWPAAVALVAAAGIAIALLANRDDTRTCATADRRLAGVWDAATRQALTAQGAAGAATARALDTRTRAWADAAVAACGARDDATIAASTLDRRDACLDRQRAQLGGLITRLRAAPAMLVDGPALVEALPPLRDCVDPVSASLELELPEDRERRALVEPHVPQIAIGHAFLNLGRYAEVDRTIASIPPGALAYPPFAAELAYLRGELESSRGDSDQGHYDEAIRLGTASGHEAVVVRAMLDQAFSLEQPTEAKRWYALVDATLSRLGDPADLRAHFYGNRTALQIKLGDHAAAIADAERAIALRREHDGPVAASTANAVNALANALMLAGRDGEARKQLVDALATAERSLDHDHSTVLTIRANLVDLHLRATDFAAARAQYEILLAARQRIYGDTDPDRFELQLKRGMILISDGADADAITVLEAVRARAPDAPGAQLGFYQMLAVAYSRTGRHQDAIAAADASLPIAEKAFGAEHPAYVSIVTQLAYILYKANEIPRSEIEARRSVALAAKLLPKDSPGAANPANVLALVMCARRDFAGAKQHAERAIELAKERPDVQAEAELALACALDGAGNTSAAIAAAERSVAIYTKLGKSAAADLATAERWLREHR